MSLKIGDHLVSPRYGFERYGLYDHHGLYVGGERVIHYAGLTEGWRAGPVEIVSLQQFAQNRPVFVKHRCDRTFDRVESVERGLTRTGENRYSILSNNCEHFVEWCVTGAVQSPQVSRAAQGVAAASLQTIGVEAACLLGAGAALSAAGVAMALAMSTPAIVAAEITRRGYRAESGLDFHETAARRSARRAVRAAGLLSPLAAIVAPLATAPQGASDSFLAGLEIIGSGVGGGVATGAALTAAAAAAITGLAGLSVYSLMRFLSTASTFRARR